VAERPLLHADTMRLRASAFVILLILGCGGQTGEQAPAEDPANRPAAPPTEADPTTSDRAPAQAAGWALDLDEQGWPRLQDQLPTYRLELSPENLKLLNADPWADVRVPGTFTSNGRSWAVEVSYRGFSTRNSPKKSFQIRFSKDDRFEGRRQTELLAEWRDGGGLTDKLWYDLAAAAGVKIPLARFVELEVNGAYQGVYTELETVKKDFLEPHGFDGDADIYRCGMFDCELRMPPRGPGQAEWEKRTNEDAPWDELWAFLALIHRTPDAELEATLDRAMDLDGFINWMAVDTLIANDWQGDSRSFLVFDRASDRWTYVPWDLNNAASVYDRRRPLDESPKSGFSIFGFTAYNHRAYEIYEARAATTQPGVLPTWSTLSQRVLMNPALRSRYVERLSELLQTRFTSDQLGARIDAARALIEEPLDRDPFVDAAFPPRSADYLKRFVSERRAFLLNKLGTLRLPQETSVVVDRVGRDAAGRYFVELSNVSTSNVNLDGLFLTSNHRVTRQTHLANRSLAPGASVTLWEGAKGSEVALPVTIDRSRPELGLFDRDGETVLDLVWIPDLEPGRSIARK
jgi:spore coat protein H